MGRPGGDGLKAYYKSKIEELELMVKDKTHNLRRLEAQRNELNTQGERMVVEGPGFLAQLFSDATFLHALFACAQSAC